MIAFLADAFVKATILLLLAAGVSVLLRRAAAAYRHLVWLIAGAGVLVLPIASALTPDLTVPAWPELKVPVAFDAEQIAGPALHEQTRNEPAAPPAATVRTSVSPSQAPVTPEPTTGDAVRFQLTPDWTLLIVPVWLAGLLLVSFAIGIGLVRIAWLERTSEPVEDPEWLLLLAALQRRLGIGRSVRLLRAAGPAMPMTWGLRRPAILLPRDADMWAADRRRDVLVHELAHVKRLDFVTQLVARAACAVYWFHPLVWLAAARLRVERERACDDQVLRAGTKPSAYASHLLDIARALRPARATALASVAMARPSQLASRLLDVLDADRPRDIVSPRAAAPAWIAAAMVVLPLAALAPRVAEPAAKEAASVDTTPRMPVPMLIVQPRARVQAPTSPPNLDSLIGCPEDGSHGRRSSHTSINNDEITVSVTIGKCVVTLMADDKFTFNEDFTDIARVASGRVSIGVDYGRTDRLLTIREGGSRTFRVDGQNRAFDAEARAWLTDVLTFLLRRTGYAAQERARWILDKSGVQGLLDETRMLGSDYARRIYYQAALESGKLDVAGYERIITEAGQSISSDYELAELLIAVANAQPLSERMQTGFVTAAKTIQSDYERRRVLQAALSRPGLTTSVQNSMLEAAQGISSDYELASLLIELNEARRVDDAVRPAFFKAANSIASDYEHRRVLTSVVGQSGASSAILADALASAKTIDSDYELAQLLTEVAEEYGVDDALRPAFLAAAGTIGSDYEHGRALKSLLARGTITIDIAVAIVGSARGIASDYELSQVLLAVIEKIKPNDALRAAIRSATDTIQSSYERSRVLDALLRRSGNAELQ